MVNTGSLSKTVRAAWAELEICVSRFVNDIYNYYGAGTLSNCSILRRHYLLLFRRVLVQSWRDGDSHASRKLSVQFSIQLRALLLVWLLYVDTSQRKEHKQSTWSRNSHTVTTVERGKQMLETLCQKMPFPLCLTSFRTTRCMRIKSKLYRRFLRKPDGIVLGERMCLIQKLLSVLLCSYLTYVILVTDQADVCVKVFFNANLYRLVFGVSRWVQGNGSRSVLPLTRHQCSIHCESVSLNI